MIKFLLCLPLVVFIALEGFIIYQLGSVLFWATEENVAAFIGEWSFFHVVLAMVGMIIGIVMAAFLYITIVMKPAFYPPLVENDKPNKNKSRRSSAAPPPEGKSKLKLIIILVIIGAVVIGLAVTGFIFREQIGGFFGSIFSSEEADGEDEPEAYNDDADGNEEEDYGGGYEDEYNGYDENDGYEDYYEEDESDEGDEEETLPLELDSEEITRLSYQDLVYNWTLYYPEGLTIVDTELPTWDSVRVPSDTETQMLYWSANSGGLSGAVDFVAADPDGILGAARNSMVIDDNVVIAIIDGVGYSSVRFWHINPEGIAYVDITTETAEMADRWFTRLGNGYIYIE